MPPPPLRYRLIFSSEVPIDEYKYNLERMVAHVRKVHPEARVLLIAPPPVHEVRGVRVKQCYQAEGCIVLGTIITIA